MPRLITILPVLALLLAIAPAAPVPKVPEPAQYYFPTKVGAKWVYWFSIFKKDVEEKVEAVETKDREFIVSVRRDPMSKTILKQEKVAVSARGLVRIGEGGHPLHPPLWLLRLPHRPGEKWDHVDQGRNKSTYEVGKAETVEVPAGRFWAIPVTRHWSQIGLPVKTTDWYAPGVGLVKRVGKYGEQGQEVEVTEIVLKSFTPGKDKPKTTAEMLIGKWKLVRLPDGNPVSHDLDSTNEYTKDGKMIIRNNDPKNRPRVEELTYKVERNTVHFHSERRAKDQQDWSVTIKEITRDKLIFADPYSFPDHGVEYKRVETGDRK